MKEDKEKKTLKDKAKSGVYSAAKDVKEKIKNFAKRAKENYQQITGVPRDDQEKRGRETLQDKIERFNEIQFENTLRMGGFSDEAIKNIEQKIQSVGTRIMDAFDKIFDKIADRWNEYIKQSEEKKEERDGEGKV